MAMDMPPQVEYRIERPAPSRDAGTARIAAAIAATRQAAASRSMVHMPELDAASTSMTQQDRTAVLDIQRTMKSGQPVMSGGIPDSYVGERLKLAMAQARLGPEASAMDVRQVRCRMVAMSLDARAGAYSVGGERGAQAARQSIPQATLDECRSIASGERVAAVSQKEGICTSEREQRARSGPARTAYRVGQTRVSLAQPSKSVAASRMVAARGPSL